jgi:hypothetical protein
VSFILEATQNCREPWDVWRQFSRTFDADILAQLFCVVRK